VRSLFVSLSFVCVAFLTGCGGSSGSSGNGGGSSPPQVATVASFGLIGTATPVNMPLVEAPDGGLYGTTSKGGGGGEGIVFKVSAQGALTVVYQFFRLLTVLTAEAPPAGSCLPTTATSTGRRLVEELTMRARSLG